MNIAIDIPTAVIVSAVWILLGLVFLARRYAPAKPRPAATPRVRKTKKQVERRSSPAPTPADG